MLEKLQRNQLVIAHISELYVIRCFFLRYICIAATCKVVNQELFTERLILMSLFMYRTVIVLKKLKVKQM